MQEKNDLIPQEQEIQQDVVDSIPNFGDGINNESEPVELTDEQKREQFIELLKNSKKSYKPKKHFGVNYKKERKRKNKQARASRKANRR